MVSMLEKAHEEVNLLKNEIAALKHFVTKYEKQVIENKRLYDKLAVATKENDTLRGLLGNSAKDCVYCGLPATDQAKCRYGFPGCSRADDQMLNKHFADGYRADCAEQEVKRLRDKLAAAEGKWISVEDRLPEEEQKVIYYFEVTGIDIGKFWIGDTPGFEGIKFFGGPRGFLGDDVTHWMPLPKEPITP